MQKARWVQDKMLTTKALAHRCNAWRTTGRSIVFTNGCFDILHYGHLALLADAASFGHVLVVGVNTDASVRTLKGSDRPVNHEKDRLFQMASLLCVDAVCLFDEPTPLQLIQTVRPNVLVKGGDYTIDSIVGTDFVIGNGGRVEIVPFVSGYSTTSLIHRIKEL
jgi:rfaE bifunctional protein nucleotidyltransferase chain/domain